MTGNFTDTRPWTLYACMILCIDYLDSAAEGSRFVISLDPLRRHQHHALDKRFDQVLESALTPQKP